MATVDIVIPVYQGSEETRACIASVLAARQSDCFAIQVIYDAGPDSALEQHLEELDSGGLIHLHKNARNLGFVATVNRGFLLNQDRDVIILNSDTLVPSGWAERLCEAAARDGKVATVTPFSNNGEICSFPRICHCNDLPPGMSVEAIDQFFRREKTLADIELPTGVGFCMYIARAALRDVGFFDEEAFGRGYGEENDFCRRVAARGWKNLLCQDLFVYHAGGVSFGEEKAARIANALKVIDRRYPDYTGLVSRFIATDPVRNVRAKVMATMLAADPRRIILHISHNMGGGTRRYVEELTRINEREACFLTLEPESAVNCRLNLPVWMGESLLFDVSHGLDKLLSVLKGINIDGVIVSHLKGIETVVLPLLDALQSPVWTVLHDYYFIAGNPTLTDVDGHFPSELDHGDVFSEERSENFSDLGRVRWEQLVHPILFRSRLVIAPTESVKSIYQRFLPGLEVSVHPHPDSELIGHYPGVGIRRSLHMKQRVVAIGALGKEKGADLLEAVAMLAARQGLDLEFHLLGYAYRPLNGAVITHGAYDDGRLPALLRDTSANLIWYPCQWPETYSYTLSAVLEAGLPLLVPALGALADRSVGRPATVIAPYPDSAEGWLNLIQKQLAGLDSLPDLNPWDGQPAISSFYTRAPWCLQRDARDREIAFDPALITDNLAARSSGQYISERVLELLFRIRGIPVVRSLMRLIPLQRQRQVKRWLSKKPLHEIAAHKGDAIKPMFRYLNPSEVRASKVSERGQH